MLTWEQLAAYVAKLSPEQLALPVRINMAFTKDWDKTSRFRISSIEPAHPEEHPGPPTVLIYEPAMSNDLLQGSCATVAIICRDTDLTPTPAVIGVAGPS